MIWLAGQPMSLAVASLYVFVAIDLFVFPLVAAIAQVVVLSATVSVAVVVGWLVRCADAVETDPLTGPLNRRGLDRVLAEALRYSDAGTRLLAPGAHVGGPRPLQGRQRHPRPRRG